MKTGKHKFNYVAAYLLALSILLPLFSLHASNQDGKVVCFVYHRFGDNRYPSTNIDLKEFRGQLTYLKQNNFNVWPLGKAVDAIRNQEVIPSKTVVLTIDDAYHSFYENGMPLLEEFGIPATLFINTRNVGDPDYMSWQEIQIAKENGIEIGCHSHAHLHFLDIRWDDQRRSSFLSDLATAHSAFNENLGYTPELYAYPYGEYGPVVMEVLEEAGYKAAAAQYSGVLYSGTNPMAIPRFPMGGPFATLKGFIQKSLMNPVEVIDKEPKDIVMQQNPPGMVITIDKNCLDFDNIQCFVNGNRNCIVEIQEGPENVRMKVISRDKLSGRRSLYTITAPSKDGKGWCWYSHVWVNTEVIEE